MARCCGENKTALRGTGAPLHWRTREDLLEEVTSETCVTITKGPAASQGEFWGRALEAEETAGAKA